MKLLNELKVTNKKISKIKTVGLRICLLLALFSAMILSIYKSTYILFEYYLGITLLKLSIVFFTAIFICYFAFDKILKDI